MTDWILPPEFDIRKTASIQRSDLRLASCPNAQSESLVQNILFQIVRVVLLRRILVSRSLLDHKSWTYSRIKNIPVPKLAVTAKIELSGSDAANRHTDIVKIAAVVLRIDYRLASFD